ncbi:MAG: DUF4258 domain-containing protein [Nanoarchaeota archaeon]|nr:DUF4258 domain-containing protein [Nanoarchaeota archaeon]
MKSKLLYIIISTIFYYNTYLAQFDRRHNHIMFTKHALNDKNLCPADIDCAIKTIRTGKVSKEKSTPAKGRICFKNYFKQNSKTYFVIVECYNKVIWVITVIKKNGKY